MLQVAEKKAQRKDKREHKTAHKEKRNHKISLGSFNFDSKILDLQENRRNGQGQKKEKDNKRRKVC